MSNSYARPLRFSFPRPHNILLTAEGFSMRPTPNGDDTNGDHANEDQ